MGIIKIKDKYFAWSSICDAPLTNGLDLDGLSKYVEGEYGKRGLRNLVDSLKRVEEKGFSSRLGYDSLDDFLVCNRAGEGEVFLTADEIYSMYV